ncbi:MAG: YggT family protein, partial [Spirochaetes bacterium]|nr:YggT family protein [Spirochaetota bacterium]MBU1081055.1 YggT family protein [Spirochaetota bacterium]
MNPLTAVFRLLGAATSIYMLLCVVRVFMSWFPTQALGRPGELVERATDPYLSLWRRIPVLRAGGVDFSPIAALAALSGLSRLFSVASYGALTLGVALALIVEIVWAPVGFLLGFFVVLIVARIVAYIARWNSLHPVWRAVDAMINPVLFRIKRFVYKDRIVNYMQGLVTGALALLGGRVVLGLVFGLIISLLKRI